MITYPAGKNGETQKIAVKVFTIFLVDAIPPQTTSKHKIGKINDVYGQCTLQSRVLTNKKFRSECMRRQSQGRGEYSGTEKSTYNETDLRHSRFVTEIADVAGSILSIRICDSDRSRETVGHPVEH